MQPSISIILSVYNGGEYLKQSISSVLQQDVNDFEFLISDDHSMDGSWEYLQQLNDERVKIYRQDRNRGLFPSLNELILRSRSSLIKIWSQDDIMNQGCLKEIISFHAKYPEIGFSYSDRDTIDGSGNLLPCNYIDETPEIISPDLHARIAFFCGSIAGNIANTCISRKAIETVGLFHEEMDISADFEMWVRLAQHFDTGYISKKLVRLRDHKKQLSRDRHYFIRRPIEDMHVYNYLLGYVDGHLKEEGVENLKRFKYVYYYTLMLKAVLRFDVKTAFAFYIELKKISSFWDLSKAFIKAKLKPPTIPEFIKRRTIQA